MVAPGRVELPTTRLFGPVLYQLSYRAAFFFKKDQGPADSLSRGALVFYIQRSQPARRDKTLSISLSKSIANMSKLIMLIIERTVSTHLLALFAAFQI